jgi:anti-sigma-K factor RskA
MVASMPDGSIMVKPMGSVAVVTGKDLELWALPPGASHPMPLGVLSAGGLRVAIADIVQPSTKLMVSLEPQGGSPTGQPTGPVLYSGALTRVE